MKKISKKERVELVGIIRNAVTSQGTMYDNNDAGVLINSIGYEYEKGYRIMYGSLPQCNIFLKKKRKTIMYFRNNGTFSVDTTRL